MLLLLQELVRQDEGVVRRRVPELGHEQSGVHGPRLACGELVALVVAAPWIVGLSGLLMSKRIEGVDVRVSVKGKHDVGIGADREAEMGRKIGDLSQQSGVEKHQVPLVSHAKVRVAARRGHEEARPARKPVVDSRDGGDHPSIKGKEEQVLKPGGRFQPGQGSLNTL